MAARVLAGTLTAVLLTAVVLFLGAGLLSLDGAPSPAAAFFDQGPRAVVGMIGIPFLVWAVLLVGADLMTGRRSVVVRLLAGLGVTAVVSAATLVFWIAFAGAASGWTALLVAIAVIYVALFCVAALVALAVTHLVLFRRRPAVGAAAA